MAQAGSQSDNARQLAGHITDVSIAFGAITGAFIEYKDLGLDFVYSHWIVDNTTDADVDFEVRVGGDGAKLKTFTVPAGKALTFDELGLLGIIKIKQTTGAPTSGSVTSWFW